jgi:phosphoglycolate phosphatase
MYKYKAVLFDLDGTLLNTSFDLADALNFALNKHGYKTFSTDDVVKMVGHGITNLIKTATNESDDVVNKVRVDFKNYYKEHLCDKTRPYDGIIDLLKDLKANGVYTAVVSNKYNQATKKLSDTFFGSLIDYAIGEDNCPTKPDPYMANTVIDYFNVDKKDCVFVGDADTDINTAKNTGIDCITVSWGFKSRDYLSSNGAKVIVDTVTELKHKL